MNRTKNNTNTNTNTNTKIFFNKNEEIIYIPASEFVKIDGCVKLDPVTNIRTSATELPMDKDTKDILKYSADATIENNMDKVSLSKDIFEKGYSKTKQAIVVMPLAEYLRGGENLDNLCKVYKDDPGVLARAKDIDWIYKTARSEDEAEMKLKEQAGYYVVVGGNTRVSMIMKRYHENESVFETDGSMDTEIPVSVTTFADLELNNANHTRITPDTTAEDRRKNSAFYQILWEAAILEDNASSKQNVPGVPRFIARGKLAKRMVNNFDAFGLSGDVPASHILSGYQNIVERLKVSDATFLESLFYANILAYFKEHEARKLHPSWEQHLTFVCKVLAGICSADKSRKGVEYQKFISKKTGFDYKTLDVENSDNLVEFFNWCIGMHKKTTTPANHLYTPLKRHMFVQSKKLNIGDDAFSEAKKKAQSDYLNNKSKTAKPEDLGSQDNLVEELKKAKNEIKKLSKSSAKWRTKYRDLYNKMDEVCKYINCTSVISKEKLEDMLKV